MLTPTLGWLGVIHRLGGTGSGPPPPFKPPTFPKPAAPKREEAPVEPEMLPEEPWRVGWKGTPSLIVGLYNPPLPDPVPERAYGPGMESFGAGRPPDVPETERRRSLYAVGLRDIMIGLRDIMCGLEAAAVDAAVPVDAFRSRSSLRSRSRIEWERLVEDCWRFMLMLRGRVLAGREGLLITELWLPVRIGGLGRVPVPAVGVAVERDAVAAWLRDGGGGGIAALGEM